MIYFKMRIRPPLLYAIKNTFVCLVGLYVSVLTVSGQNAECHYNNPKNICGTSVLELYQALYKLGDFNSMLKFTSSESISTFSKATILEQFEKMEFGYKLHLISCTLVGRTNRLTYRSTIYGTSAVVRVESLIENDSAKIVLPKNFLDQTIFLYW